MNPNRNSTSPQDVSKLPARHIQALLFDVDDTVTTHGELSHAAYGALHQARASGLWLCAVTGRGAGWCDLMARLWPVHAVVGETGAFAYFKDAQGRITEEFLRAPSLAKDRAQRDSAVQDVLMRFPDARISRDSAFRLCDVALDLVEDGPAVPDAQVRAMMEALTGHGLTVARSNVHINAWVGAYGKRDMVERVLQRQHLRLEDVAYAGDSRNDGPLFGYFPASVGVANVGPLLPELAALGQAPAYITRQNAGDGFVELVNHLVDQRRSAP